jgi:hypothetical protein
MRRREFLNYQFVDRLLDEHRRKQKDWGFHLWALLNLSLWYERWIDRGVGGDTETRGRGNRVMGRHGDRVTWRHGDRKRHSE